MKAPKTSTKKSSNNTVAFHARLSKANKTWLTKQARTKKTTQTSVINDVISQIRKTK